MIAALLLLLAAQEGRDFIDAEVRKKWAGVRPVPRSDDAEFLRRVTLDVAGTIPTLEEARRFLADARPDKRARLVDDLLAGEGYARNWSHVWASAILGVGDVRFQDDVAAKLPGALREHFAKNVPLDRFARAVMAHETPPPAGPRQERDGLSLFYTELLIRAGGEFPQAFAGKFSRVFLGLQIQCARCHDHPFDKWTQEEFYGMAAFYAGIRHESFGVGERKPGQVKGLAIPDSKQPPVRPGFLDTGEAPRADETLRAAFARMATASPQFARASVNRLWAHFFGRGIVQPHDAFSSARKPSHPELLEGLARQFRERDHDARWLVREICASEAYQLTARAGSREAERLYALAALRPPRPEQVVDSLLVATGLPGDRERLLQEFRRTLGHDHGTPGSRFQGAIPAALLLLNGPLSARPAGTLERILREIPGEAERLEAIFLTALSRPPRDGERARFLEYLRPRGEAGWGDALAALLNSAEFVVVH